MYLHPRHRPLLLGCIYTIGTEHGQLLQQLLSRREFHRSLLPFRVCTGNISVGLRRSGTGVCKPTSQPRAGLPRACGGNLRGDSKPGSRPQIRPPRAMHSQTSPYFRPVLDQQTTDQSLGWMLQWRQMLPGKITYLFILFESSIGESHFWGCEPRSFEYGWGRSGAGFPSESRGEGARSAWSRAAPAGGKWL